MRLAEKAGCRGLRVWRVRRALPELVVQKTAWEHERAPGIYRLDCTLRTLWVLELKVACGELAKLQRLESPESSGMESLEEAVSC